MLRLEVGSGHRFTRSSRAGGLINVDGPDILPAANCVDDAISPGLEAGVTYRLSDDSFAIPIADRIILPFGTNHGLIMGG